MHILVTGLKGQVAQALLAIARSDTRVTALGRPELDITDAASIDRAIAAYRPDVVVNAAAYTAVDQAETDADAAFAVNRDGARFVAHAAASAGLPIIQISTDFVFSGEKSTAYVETDPTGPLNVYGRSKLAGEEAVASANPRHLILRTAWVHSAFGANFVKTMLKLAEDRDVVRVVADQRGNPTTAADVASGIVAAAKKIIQTPITGIFHLASGGETTRADFAREIFLQSGKLYGLTATIEAISTSDYPAPAARPANSCLDTTKVQREFGFQVPHWREGVADSVRSTLAQK